MATRYWEVSSCGATTMPDASGVNRSSAGLDAAAWSLIEILQGGAALKMTTIARGKRHSTQTSSLARVSMVLIYQ